MQRISEGFGEKRTTRRHLLVVITFIVAASLLVVLTTFAINMLTATGDLNRLLVRWSQNNGESVEMAIRYLEDDDQASLIEYRDFTEQRMYTGDVISELMSEAPNKELIFREFDPNDIHPNEITGLIRIFTLFDHTPEIQEIKNTWASVQRLTDEKNELIDSLISRDAPTEAEQSDVTTLIQAKNHEINNYIRRMISDNSSILLLLKRYSLWFTVLLGILIVLIGVIYTVRGFKNIRGMQNLLAERDYLAMFPELNQFPVLNLNTNGEIDFINQAAKSLFPELKNQGLHHPFLETLKERFEVLTTHPENTQLFEVEVDGKYYQQAAHFLSQEKGIHVHSIDITELKKKQLELSHTLKEKDSLLGEVHHRVKNNMAVITGLLELQEMMGDNPASALSESRSRIKSMAIVHELLYQSDSYSDIGTTQYLAKIAEHLRLSLSGIHSIHVIEHESTRSLNINQAIPLGLLLNELAFHLCKEHSPNQEPLELNLQIIPRGDELCLQLSALQPSIENPLMNDDQPTLRMNLIKNLLSQIEGELLIPDSDSLLIEIKFKPIIKKGSSSTLI